MERSVDFPCPCCGFESLLVPPYDNMPNPPWFDHGDPPYANKYGAPHFVMCCCCGFEFGYDDDETASGTNTSFEEYLEEWVSQGCNWVQPRNKPDHWTLAKCLKKAQIKVDFEIPSKG